MTGNAMRAVRRGGAGRRTHDEEADGEWCRRSPGLRATREAGSSSACRGSVRVCVPCASVAGTVGAHASKVYFKG